MTKIDCWEREAFGIDQEGRLWIWGEHLKATDDWKQNLLFDPIDGIYNTGRPMCLRLF